MYVHVCGCTRRFKPTKLLHVHVHVHLCEYYQVHHELVRLDEQELNNRYKIGVIYCKRGQSTEEEMYNNGECTQATYFAQYKYSIHYSRSKKKKKR